MVALPNGALHLGQCACALPNCLPIRGYATLVGAKHTLSWFGCAKRLPRPALANESADSQRAVQGYHS